MATTYNPALSADGGLNEARFDLGDVGHIKSDTGSPIYILQDEEITARITKYGYREGVARAAESCITRSAQLPDVYEDDSQTRVEWKTRMDAWKSLIKRLRDNVGDVSSPGSSFKGSKMNDPAGLDSLF